MLYNSLCFLKHFVNSFDIVDQIAGNPLAPANNNKDFEVTIINDDSQHGVKEEITVTLKQKEDTTDDTEDVEDTEL